MAPIGPGCLFPFVLLYQTPETGKLICNRNLLPTVLESGKSDRCGKGPGSTE
jgi:hypothetical protein